MNCCWCAITTDQLEESVAFYKEVTGLSMARCFFSSPNTEIALLRDDHGFEVELLKNGRPTSDDLNRISLRFEAEPLVDTLTLVKSKDTSAFGGLIKIPGCTFFFVKDPNGVSIQLIESGY